MRMPELSSPLSVEPVVASADPRVAEDPLLLLHQYQQRLRAELLEAAAHKPTPARSRVIGIAARAVHSQVVALTHAVSYFSFRQTVSAGAGLR